MPVRNLHRKPFDQATRDKLVLYREYLREWLPVFINGSSVDILHIFDFFAVKCKMGTFQNNLHEGRDIL